MKRKAVPRDMRPDSMRGFAEDAPFEDNMYDRYQGRYFDKYRAPYLTTPDWSYDRYDKLKPVPTGKGKAKAKPIPMNKKRSTKDYVAALKKFLDSRRG